MTIDELYDIWYKGDTTDMAFANTCYNMLGAVGTYTYEDDVKYRQLLESIENVMEDYLYDCNK